MSKNSLKTRKFYQYKKKKINLLLDDYYPSKYSNIFNKNNYKKI